MMGNQNLLDENAPIEEIVANLKQNIEENGGLVTNDLREEDVILLYQMGYGMYQKSLYAEAEEVFQKLVIARSYEVKYWKGLASVQQMQQNYKQAITSWSMCCLIDDKNAIYHFHAAECLFSLKDFDQAKTALAAAENRAGKENDQSGSQHDGIADKIKFLKERWGL